MTNKKLQNNQNKKNVEGPTINGNSSTGTATSTQSSTQNINATLSNVVQNNNSVNSNSATPTQSLTTNSTNAISLQQNQSLNQSSTHQRNLSTSSSSQQINNLKQASKKTSLGDTEKTNNNASSQSHQGGSLRSSGKNEQRTKEKEKEKNVPSSGKQNNHYTTYGYVNQQSSRKKENKNRDHSNQSHRGGYGAVNQLVHGTVPQQILGAVNQQAQGAVNQQGHGMVKSQACGAVNQPSSHALDSSKSSGFPSNSSLSSIGQNSSPPAAVGSFTPTTQLSCQESKTVQTDPQNEDSKKKKEKTKNISHGENRSPFNKYDPKQLDSVMAFNEHDAWDKIELICELISFLAPTDLRLLGNCIEGSVRCYTNQMRPVEKTSNSAEPTASLPQFICSPSPSPEAFHPHAVPDAATYNQRVMINNVFGQHGTITQFNNGMPQVVYPVEANYRHNSTVSSTLVSAAPKDGNGIITPVSTTGSITKLEETTCATEGTGVLRASVVNTDPENGVPVVRPLSSLSQSSPLVPQEPAKFLKSVLELTSYIYILMSVCSSTNRKSAAKISDYVKNVILREKTQILERIPDEIDKISVLQDIGKIFSAMTHHPAVSLDDKIIYSDMRDGLRAEIESLFRKHYSTQKICEQTRLMVPSAQGVGDIDDTEESEKETDEGEEFDAQLTLNSRFCTAQPSCSATCTYFITRFIGRQVENNDNLFCLEIHWSDGDRTFAQRTREQLRALQHRLLDEFGQQRSEKFHHNGGSTSSFDDDNKKLSTSTSTMETTCAPSGERIVPRLARDATPMQYVQYINELSDLPARMMLSSVISEEFNGTRSRTEDEYGDSSDGLIFSRWKNPRAKSPVRYFQRNAAGAIDPIELPVNLQPFLYSNVPQNHIQTLFPSCSNCGGTHVFKNCDKPTLLDKQGDHKIRLDPEGGQSASVHVSGNMSSSASYAPLNPHPHTHLFIDSNQAMISAGHFGQHPHQQLVQNAMFHNGQYRTNGAPFDVPVPYLVFNAPTVPNTVSSGGGTNNVNCSSVNQNGNF